MSGHSSYLEIRQARAAVFRRMTMPTATLIVVRDGRKSIGLDDGSMLVAKPGQAIALSAGDTVDVTNALSPSGVYRANVYCFDSDLIDKGPFAAQSLQRYGCITVSGAMEDCLERCRASLNGTDNLPDAVQRHRLCEVLVWLDTAGIRLQGTMRATLAGRIRALVMADPAARWDTIDVLGVLASAGEAMSAATLRRRLAAEHHTLTNLVTDTRLTIALSALQSSTVSVTQIALDAGYESASRFSVRFRARFGISPSEIRGHRRLIDPDGTKIDRRGIARMAAE